MDNTQFSSQTAIVQLEVVPEDDQQVDVADIDEIRRFLFDQLTDSGYTVKSVFTGAKGTGGVLDIWLQIAHFLHENKDWLLGSIPPVLECLLIARDRLAGQEKTKRPPLKITLEVNGQSIDVETSDPKNITKLLEHLQTTSPDKVKIQVRAHKKKRRP